MFRKWKIKKICAVIGLIIVLDYFGLFTHFFEISYHENFIYPYEGDIQPYVFELRQNKTPSVPIINKYNYSYIHNVENKFENDKFSSLRIVFLVKSAVENFNRREAIRRSWGFENRFSDVFFKTIFLLGTHFESNELKLKVDIESINYHDIVQGSFEDAYFNNTIKTMMGFHWAVTYCSKSKYYMFVDDDMYVSVKNVLRFIRNPAMYPDYIRDNYISKYLFYLLIHFLFI